MTDTTNSWTKRTDNINRIYRELSKTDPSFARP